MQSVMGMKFVLRRSQEFWGNDAIMIILRPTCTPCIPIEIIKLTFTFVFSFPYNVCKLYSCQCNCRWEQCRSGLLPMILSPIFPLHRWWLFFFGLAVPHTSLITPLQLLCNAWSFDFLLFKSLPSFPASFTSLKSSIHYMHLNLLQGWFHPAQLRL